MVGRKDETPRLGNPFQVNQLEMQVEIVDHAAHEIYPLLVMIATQNLVQLRLMDSLS